LYVFIRNDLISCLYNDDEYCVQGEVIMEGSKEKNVKYKRYESIVCYNRYEELRILIEALKMACTMYYSKFLWHLYIVYVHIRLLILIYFVCNSAKSVFNICNESVDIVVGDDNNDTCYRQ
jgi:hypothetical protein